MDPLVAIGGTGLVTAVFLQYLKKATWIPFMGTTPNFEKINLLISVIIAFLTSVGVSYSYDHVTGDAAIKLSTHQLGHWIIQWASQHVSYKAFVVPSELLAAIVNQLKSMQQSAHDLQTQNSQDGDKK